MKRKIRFWLLGVAGCLILAAAWALLAAPGTALAKPPNKGQFNTRGHWVWFSQDALGAFAPEGLPPNGSADDNPRTDQGSLDVVAGAIWDEKDPRMIVNFNQTCLTSGSPETDPNALSSDDLSACFPVPSQGTMIIPADGTTVQMNIHGLSTSGRELGYRLTIDVTNPTVWDPLNLDPGTSVTLLLGAWTLTTSNPKQQSKGCSASGDFISNTAITVQRWTPDEQAAQDACE